MTVCIVSANLRVQGATPAQAERLLLGARVRSPEYAKAIRAGSLPWRLPAEWIEFGRRDGDDVVLSRGFSSLVREVLPGVHFDDRRLRGDHPYAAPARTLRPEQAECVSIAARGQQGMIVGPCGSGKSTIILGTIAACGQKAAIVVPTLPIASAFLADIPAVLGVQPGMIGGGRDDLGDVTVATSASLRDPVRRARLFAHIGALFVDECHGVTGPETRAIVDECPAAIRLGFTATPPTDERRGIVAALFGRVLHRLATPTLVNLGRLARPTYRQVETTFESDAEDFGALVDATTHDDARNALAVQTVTANVGPGCLGLALFGRVEHAERIAGVLRDAGLRCEALTGSVRPSERERILAAARAGELDVLCATSLADEGLDVPTIARVFLVAPQKAGGRFVQRIGRAMRPSPGKPEPVIFDFIDERHGLLAHQARGRARAFANIWREEAFAA